VTHVSCMMPHAGPPPKQKGTAMQHRAVMQWIGALAVGFLFLSGMPHARGDDVVRVAVGVDPVYTPWWIAQEKGFYQKHGIKAEITQFSGGPALADATMAGETDISSSGTATWMPRIVRGSMVVLGTMATSTKAYGMAALSRIKSLHDLKGKKVGSVGGSSTDYLWYLVAKKLDASESAFELVSIQPPELISSLDRGDVDAFFCWEPWPARAVETSGKDKVHILATSGDIGYLLNFIVAANKKFVEAKPDATARVLAALHDAIEFQNNNPAEAIRVGAESNKLKPELSSFVLGLYKFSLGQSPEMEAAARTEEAWLRAKARLKGEPIDWSKTIDLQYLHRAMGTK
jgi:ABC-type nitrate/sulfonate/bicarbonate transport system substrate-binding protein